MHSGRACFCRAALPRDRPRHARQYGLSLSFSRCCMSGLRSLPWALTAATNAAMGRRPPSALAMEAMEAIFAMKLGQAACCSMATAKSLSASMPWPPTKLNPLGRMLSTSDPA
eukprot:4092098-Pyramimonas_sp.AAC.1